MRYTPIEPPRSFEVGLSVQVEMKDCARLHLEPDEQVTFVTETGAEYDVARKDFGYYATPSLNGRLRDFGLRAALVRNRLGRYFIMLVERGKDDAFTSYLAREQLWLVCWMDSDEALEDLQRKVTGDSLAPLRPALSCVCGATDLDTVHVFTRRPAGETEFTFTRDRPYHRTLQECPRCGHYRSAADMDPAAFYGGEYVVATYGDDGIRAAFDRIVGLDPAASDNAGRVRRVNELAGAHGLSQTARRLLDVGSGLCVFPHAMKAAGWTCTVIDPDPRAVSHARDVVRVEAVCGDFLDAAADTLGRFDLLTFNKVLEHVEDPVAMLHHAAAFLAAGGLVYAEVPDGPEAFADDPGREEFYIDHLHVFSFASTAQLAVRAGLRPLLIERLREPSGKYTIRALMRPAA